ncbi:hypothetical protein [Yoonia sediminilitoris]|uniref:Uncharacterized protein n=1 Tax=Yoonia sediminilitoris TaxID=1286148 RepID=A0A2T6KAJ1_9RHOB|nr:hypothetical protein [Yoonia sediminilitoris]PUB11851.1 hypothetical protein C8N45_11294 [Yoonia sediminilitoris]RCW91928.1 hypothetical protein DFP92_11294 [Yoonia sediminilitoris]
MPFSKTLTAASIVAITSASAAFAQKAMLSSAGALAFDNGNTLFVGDGKAGLVHAFDLGDQVVDQAGYQLGRAQTFEGRTIFNNLDVEIAGLLGVEPHDVVINDMVVHKPSKQVFLSVHRGEGPDAEAVIIAVNNGLLELVDLTTAEHSSMSVGAVPTTETLEFGQSLSTLAITDIDYYNGELLVAGLSNEEFSSKLRRMPYPFTNEVSTSSIEIWHAVHAQYETRAPIISQTVTELNGEPTLIAIYACTPIVRIPLADLTDGAEVRGTMIGEMGFGNTPLDIVPYVNAWDGSSNVVVTNSNRSAAALPLDAVASAEAMPHGEGVQPVFSTAGVYQFPLPMSGTMHLDTLDENYAVVIRRSPEDTRNIQLHTLPLPFFFDRADHIVEMNFEDSPDPFGYKAAPPLEYN